MITLPIYVDDIMIISNEDKEVRTLCERLSNEFNLTALGRLYYLGIEVAYPNQGIFLSQQKYILYLLKKTKKIRCNSINNCLSKGEIRSSKREQSSKLITLLTLSRQTTIFEPLKT